ncbi:unnamed protein product [uncultured bacterium]|nr:unnamed protein product [uncultured bacterium]
MSLTVCCIVAHALRGSLSCCAHSVGAPILKLNICDECREVLRSEFPKLLVHTGVQRGKFGNPSTIQRCWQTVQIAGMFRRRPSLEEVCQPSEKLRRFRFRSPFRPSFSRGACEHDKPSSRPLSVKFPAALQYQRTNGLPARSKSTDF